MTEFVVEASRLTKYYEAFTAVDAVSLQVPRGAIYGVLGPNGAGKTTTLRMILGIIDPDDGECRLLGSTRPASVRARIGYLPEERGLYPGMKAREAIAFMGALRGLDWRTGRSRGAEFMEALVRRERDRGATVLFSTHVMAHAERLCDRLAVIARSQRRFEGSVDEARALLPMQVRFTPRADADPLSVAGLLPSAAVRNGEHWQFTIEAEAVEPLLIRLTGSGLGVAGLSIARPGLHDAFVHIVRQVDADYDAQQAVDAEGDAA